MTQGKRKPYSLTSPCANCPFRSDIEPYLRRGRVEEMERDLVRSEFHCHKTLDYSKVHEDDDEPGEENAAHCAGALILLEKLGRPSQMMRIAERLGLYDARKLNMEAPVFNSFEEMGKAQEAGWKSQKSHSSTRRLRSGVAKRVTSSSQRSTTPSGRSGSRSGTTSRGSRKNI